MKEKFELEYNLNCSPKVLYTMLSTPGGLSEWFSDDVNVQGKIFTFFWNGAEEQAELIMQKEGKFMRFRWLEFEEDDSRPYFEFRINTDELTNEVALIVTDFAENDEIVDAEELWESQIGKLKHVLGI